MFFKISLILFLICYFVEFGSHACVITIIIKIIVNTYFETLSIKFVSFFDSFLVQRQILYTLLYYFYSNYHESLPTWIILKGIYAWRYITYLQSFRSINSYPFKIYFRLSHIKNHSNDRIFTWQNIHCWYQQRWEQHIRFSFPLSSFCPFYEKQKLRSKI